MTSYTKAFKDCYVQLEDGKLSIGNKALERVWDMNEDLPIVKSLKNKSTGKEWLTGKVNGEWRIKPENQEARYAFFKENITVGKMKVLGAEADTDDDIGIGKTHLRIVLKLEFDNFLVDWIHLVYPELPIMRSFIMAGVKNGVDIEKLDPQEARPEEWPTDYADCYPLEPQHCRWESVSFYDRTDVNDNLVQTMKGILSRRESKPLQGNLLFTEDYMDHEGVLLVKEGPTPFAYLNGIKSDYLIKGYSLYTTGWGFDTEDLKKTESVISYGSAVILWDGAMENAYAALNQYHRAIRVFVARRDAQVMSNTWGDWNADARISEEFMLAELRKAKVLGIDFCQLDDGWQKGTTCNSVNAAAFAAAQKEKVVWGKGYYKADPEFWTPNPTRLPNGLSPLADFANGNDIRLGLWFSADYLNDYENWERDCEVILNMYREHGVKAFKLDGIGFHNKVAEQNFTNMLHRVLEATNNEVLFNIDATAGRRTGFFGRVQYGSLFLENRFTDKFGDFPNYWPHLTLRNLWSLSRYINPERLQVEFLNVYRNQDHYGDDPIAPAKCGIEYAFAITMFSSPLAWFEMTSLDEKASDILEKVIPIYRGVQADILSGYVQPIGNEPDGTEWTGFQSIKGKGEGYIQIIREYNDTTSHTYRLVGLKNATLRLESILGYGKQTTVKVDGEGCATFELDAPLSYALYKYSV